MDQNNMENNLKQESVFDQSYNVSNAGFTEGDIFADIPSIVNVVDASSEQAVRCDPVIDNSNNINIPIINEMATPIEVNMPPVVFPVLEDNMDLNYSSYEDNSKEISSSEEIELKPKDDLDIYDLIDINQNILIDNPVTEKDESLEVPKEEIYEEVSIDYDLEKENTSFSNINKETVNSDNIMAKATDYNSPINVQGAYEESFSIPGSDEEII